MKQNRIAILGAVGVPGSYGGFETLANNLVDYHGASALGTDLAVYCSSKAFPAKPQTYGSARLRYVNLDANGPQSIPYDVLSLFDAVRRGDTHLLLLGVSGALALPIVRLVSRARIVTNIDGIEWKREKWNGLAKAFLRASEWAAVRFSHAVIADNQAIADHVNRTYRRSCEVISYGGDHALVAQPDPSAVADLPSSYALALCRIEPENNVAMILEAFSALNTPLVFVGNWGKSDYSRDLKWRYKDHPTITIHDPVYEPRSLRAIRDRASIYVHGHSAGGTNPSLVEMMQFGIPVLAHGCAFNRYTTEDRALYFETPQELAILVRGLSPDKSAEIGSDMQEIASRRYNWIEIGKCYFDIIDLKN
ncbi:DUF1972 domain-containing protein [Sphingobium baderi]|uniref:DUF1972 domain-containing protein n=1 Tax=Sphingobium baderi TaxID=1332080 RepID=UPI002B40C9C2|nr:DUF1972 domain-containing protein [Sphingobium baderi]WRD78812.1 DUF1972 domain-containing protein [Sphingobium baderi]